MNVTDQTVKLRIILLTAALGLVGFFFEVGPVGGAFSLVNSGLPVFDALALELRTLGFLAYLALAASAVVGLHPDETEPTPKEEKAESTKIKPAGEGEAVGERVRVRPELHQMSMLFAAWGGYALLKGVNLVLMGQTGLVDAARLRQAFEFGFLYIALGWFVLWQFLRWYAQRRRWIRLQAELVGGDIARIIAGVFLVVPFLFLINLARGAVQVPMPMLVVTALLNATVVAASIILWTARPLTLRRTVIALCIDGAVVILLTLLAGALESGFSGL